MAVSEILDSSRHRPDGEGSRMKTPVGFAQTVATLERAAERFYRKQAQLQRNQGTRNILESIAEEEARHAECIVSMAEEPANAAALEAAASAGGPILRALLDLDEGMERTTMGPGMERDGLELALVLERETLVFYKALSDAVGPPDIKVRIRNLFQREKGHFGKVRILSTSWGPVTVSERRGHTVSESERAC
jgi:rubrerythrin